MKILKCQLQMQAKKQVISALHLNDLVFLQGKPLCGKSTLLSFLFSRIDSARKIWPIVIRSSHAHLCGSLKQSLVSALGLPHWIANDSPGALLNLLREINSSGLSVVLVIDDIDTFVSGPRSKHPELCEFILFLRNEIKFLKVVVTLTNFNSVATLARDFRFSRNCVLELRCWSSGSEFQQFVVYVARACNIERRQVIGEDFLTFLHCSTCGATGSVIQTMKVLAMSGVLTKGQVATPRHISHLWRF
ncbi:ATP-binding protein [Pseudomonas asiatica]|uniref:ATP-binding protein n=1 Tax=Pseudomonas asiatica TaxID=2219225 RepID=A0AAJ5ILE7_9PSED|nr:ATP-binding protein [Pseudomonas asiatica]UUC21440.1 ATP-binding protein [Pseudomonas asiatica]